MSPTNNLVTKDFFKNEMKSFVTKDFFKNEMRKFVTKDFFKNEIKRFEKIFRQSIGLDIDLKIRESEERVEEKAQKRQSQLLNKLDDFLKEVRDSREERVTAGKQLSDHEQRLEKLEDTVFVH